MIRKEFQDKLVTTHKATLINKRARLEKFKIQTNKIDGKEFKVCSVMSLHVLYLFIISKVSWVKNIHLCFLALTPSNWLQVWGKNIFNALEIFAVLWYFSSHSYGAPVQVPALEMRCQKMPAWVSFLLFGLNNGCFFSFLPSPFNNRIPALTLLSSRFYPGKSKAKRLRKPDENQHLDFLHRPQTWHMGPD